MRGGALFFLLFVGGSAFVLLTDVFDAPGNELTELLGELGKKTEADTEPEKELTLDERVAALEKSATELQRRVRDVRDSGSALAGTNAALDALIARLEELAANAGMLPRDVVEPQLDALERDFELRELMVQGSKEVAETGPDEISTRRDELRKEARALRETAHGKAELLARLDKVDATLVGIEPPQVAEVKEADAVKQARARFDKGVTALRKKLG